MMLFSKAGLQKAVIVAGLMMTAGNAVAQDISESHLAAARAAIESINATDQFDGILPNLALALKSSLIANNPDLEEAISTFVDEEAIKLAARRADLEREAAMVYARALREEDLRAIAAFYTSEAGVALLQNGPIVSREVTNAAGVWQAGMERDLRDSVNERLKAADLRDVTADEGAAPSAN